MNKRGMNKRGSEMAIGTLVVIVLAVIVLVVLILGFTMGWNNLWNKITPYIGGNGGNNADSIKNSCDILCKSASLSPSSKDEFCNSKKTLVLEKEKIIDTCNILKARVGLSCDITC